MNHCRWTWTAGAVAESRDEIKSMRIRLAELLPLARSFDSFCIHLRAASVVDCYHRLPFTEKMLTSWVCGLRTSDGVTTKIPLSDTLLAISEQSHKPAKKETNASGILQELHEYPTDDCSTDDVST